MFSLSVYADETRTKPLSEAGSIFPNSAGFFSCIIGKLSIDPQTAGELLNISG
jgi:hypothetical protein